MENGRIDKAARIVEKALQMARTKRPASATEPSKAAWTERTQDDPNPVAVPATSARRLGLAEDFTEAGAVALAKAKDFLAIPIDFRQLADPAWLNNGENRKNAAILLRLAQEQMNVAMQLIRDQLDAARLLPARGAFDYQQKVLEQLIDDIDRDEDEE